MFARVSTTTGHASDHHFFIQTVRFWVNSAILQHQEVANYIKSEAKLIHALVRLSFIRLQALLAAASFPHIHPVANGISKILSAPMFCTYSGGYVNKKRQFLGTVVRPIVSPYIRPIVRPIVRPIAAIVPTVRPVVIQPTVRPFFFQPGIFPRPFPRPFPPPIIPRPIVPPPIIRPFPPPLIPRPIPLPPPIPPPMPPPLIMPPIPPPLPPVIIRPIPPPPPPPPILVQPLPPPPPPMPPPVIVQPIPRPVPRIPFFPAAIRPVRVPGGPCPGGASLGIPCDPRRPWPQCPPQSYCFAVNTVDIGPYYCCPVWSTYGAPYRPWRPYYPFYPFMPYNWPPWIQARTRWGLPFWPYPRKVAKKLHPQISATKEYNIGNYTSPKYDIDHNIKAYYLSNS
ncbi:Uncharacterized protein T4D_12591 [Trichinella pseudospiralis]|uniref:Uncharacterized protein n=1 Tax=Trichinella pseudospiralis TaxID=6337 RepID=A0A0V1FAJ4_TRIPS|nr:Uncharacterized protein T4D_12591 [Trichinella pseudospiralis]